MRNTIFAFILTLVTLTPYSGEAANLYTIIVADTSADNIGDTVETDLNNVQTEMDKVAAYTNLEQVKIIFKDANVLTDNVLSTLKTLDIHDDDVIFFYFSGHGYRTNSKDGNPWPNLYFTWSNKGIDFDYATNILKSKNPQLLITIADCCNNFIDESWAPLEAKSFALFARPDENKIRKSYQKLFLETHGVIQASGSQVGQYSFCNFLGGFYTNAFFRNLKLQVEGNHEPSWQIILDRAAYDIRNSQDPEYIVNVK